MTFSISNIKIDSTLQVSTFSNDNTLDKVLVWDDTNGTILYKESTSEFFFKKIITSAEILALNTTPIELVPAQGANTIIVPTTILAEMDYNTTPYATEGEVDIFCGGTRHVLTLPPNDGFLFGTVSRIVQAVPDITTSATSTQYVANQPLTLSMGGNPTAGDSDIILRGFYKVIDIS
jgi:hypothetical protein